MKKGRVLTIASLSGILLLTGYRQIEVSLCSHKIRLDSLGKIVSWITPQSGAYDQFLRARWSFVKTRAPLSPGPAPRSSFPQYYFYCAYKDASLEPDTWMNDVGEKIPNWFESARLYYAYTGDSSVMSIVKKLIDYTLEHGTSPSGFAWPDFPYTTTNAGDMDFHGFTNSKRFVRDEIQVDHAGDIGLTYYKMYLYTGDKKYKNAAVNVANALAKNARTGSATRSVWPYRIVMSSGKITAEYGANWFGCISLLTDLMNAGIGDTAQYRAAIGKAVDFILQFPMQTGYWTDGHTDTDVNSHTYKSNMSASNAVLYILDHPEIDPHWKEDIPKLIRWTEDNFVDRCLPGELPNMWGANIVGEQDSFLVKMDYQTARYGAECARWFAVSGDASYKEKAYRALNWVTYCSDTGGMAYESPLSTGITNWWSDCYGEGPRMFYHAFAAIPAWTPPGENHILYSTAVLREVILGPGLVRYSASDNSGIDYLHTAFKPVRVSLNGTRLSLQTDPKKTGYVLEDLGGGNYAVNIRRSAPGEVIVSRE